MTPSTHPAETRTQAARRARREAPRPRAFATPPVGTHWRVRNNNGRENVLYRLEAVDHANDPTYCYRLRLVEVVATGRIDRKVGEDTIVVELAWFTVRADVTQVERAS